MYVYNAQNQPLVYTSHSIWTMMIIICLLSEYLLHLSKSEMLCLLVRLNKWPRAGWLAIMHHLQIYHISLIIFLCLNLTHIILHSQSKNELNYSRGILEVITLWKCSLSIYWAFYGSPSDIIQGIVCLYYDKWHLLFFLKHCSWCLYILIHIGQQGPGYEPDQGDVMNREIYHGHQLLLSDSMSKSKILSCVDGDKTRQPAGWNLSVYMRSRYCVQLLLAGPRYCLLKSASWGQIQSPSLQYPASALFIHSLYKQQILDYCRRVCTWSNASITVCLCLFVCVCICVCVRERVDADLSLV